MASTPKLIHGIDSQLTVANGTGTITLMTATIPTPTGALDGIAVLINGNHTGGANGSFKANGTAGSYLEAWIEIQPADDANWRRLTASSDAYRIYTNSVNDILAIDEIECAAMFRVQCALSVAPTATIDLDFMVMFETDQKR